MSRLISKTNKEGRPSVIERLCRILRELLDVATSLYMVVLMVVLPLYTTRTGYRHIGTEKCLFFRSASLTACKVVLPLAALYLLCLGARRFLGKSMTKGMGRFCPLRI